MEHAHASARIRDWLPVGLITFVIIASLPLLAALAFALRPAVLATGLVVLIVGSCLYAFSRQAREWIDAHAGRIIGYRGLRLAPGCAFHPSHSWARVNDVVVVGADDLVQATLGPVDRVELPSVGRCVRQGQGLFRLRSAQRCLEVRAPVSGTVIASNQALRFRPSLINETPFGEGWVVRLRSADPVDQSTPTAQQPLLRGHRARRWFRQEVDHVLSMISGSEAPESPAEAADLHGHIDDAAWRRLKRSVFGRRPLLVEEA